mgnify:CR=1 FL=1
MELEELKPVTKITKYLSNKKSDKNNNKNEITIKEFLNYTL